MAKKYLVILILIIFLAAFVRLFNLTTTPPSLNWDEISHGYNAFSILKTGMDQWGEKLPILNFRAYGDYPTTLNLYLTIPFIFVLGLSEFAIRLPHAILGILTVVSVYFLTLGITKKENISLLAAFLVALEPWYIFTSRFVLQSNLSVFLLITSAAFFIHRQKNKSFIVISAILLFLTLFSYHTTRIISPLILIGTALIFKSEIKNKAVYLFLGLFVAASAYILFNPEARVRGNLLFLINQAAINKIETSRNTTKLPPIVSKFIYNKPVYFVTNFTKNYISYFSPKFLFLSGGTQYQFSVPNTGLVHIVGLPFFYIGLFLLIKNSFKDKNYRLLLLWLLVAPIPASITNESYTVLRASTLLPLPEILISISLFWVLDRIPNKFKQVGVAVFCISVFLLLESYLTNYFGKYREEYSWSWQYGYKEVVEYSKTHYNDYDNIIITKKYGEPHEFFLFYLNYDPDKYLNGPKKVAFYKDSWWWVDRFDKFWFLNDWDIQSLTTESKNVVDCNTMKCLMITSPGNGIKGWRRVGDVKFLDGKTAFEIFDNK